jgi:hypothetical protein
MNKRIIKFRGKRLDNGEWVYGGYFHIDYHNSVDYVERGVIILENAHEFEVDPETVGQFTWLHDKNGKEIYEGDIVKEPEGSKYEIYYEAPRFVMRCNSGDYTLQTPQYLEVIGNVYENPELKGHKE